MNAEILLWESNHAGALSLLEPQPPTELPLEFQARRTLTQARALYSLGKLDEADSRITEAESLARSGYTALLPDVILARGTLRRIQHLYSEAERELETARRLAREQRNQIVEAKVLGTLIVVYASQGLFDKAIDHANEALELSQSIGAKHIEAGVRLNVGWSYLELGDFEQAIPFFQDSEARASQSDLKRIQEESLNSLGRIYFNQGKYEAAVDYYNRALAVAQNVQDEQSVGLYSDNLALVFLSLGRLDLADTYNQKALKVQEAIRDRQEELRSRRTEASIADARKEFTKAKSILTSVLADKDTPISVRWEAEDELATLYIAVNKAVQAEIEFKKALAMLNTSWETIKEEEHKLAFSTWAADFYTDYIGFLVNQGEYGKALQVAESMRARTLEEAIGIKKSPNSNLLALPSVHSYLAQQKQVILAYWLAPEKSFLWIVTPSQLKLFPLPPKRQIEEKVEEYQKDVINLGDPLKDSPVGKELYRILIEPARQLIPPDARVAVIPDGNLGKLNFETLIVPGSEPRYWIDNVELKEASSISLLMRSGQDRIRGHRLLIIGDPVEVTADYRRLQHAKDEMAAATDHFRKMDKKPISGAEAKPSSYTSSKPAQYDFIHFATHGFASDTRPLDSAIVLSPDPNGNFKLYGRDIIRIPIKAEVVTISACYGAGERTYSGEGLVGLAWAFLRAGAHRVIAGLWKVDDDSTPQLMNTFYADVQNGIRPAAALRDAKRKMLHSGTVFRFPYYWASLQLYAGS